MVLSILNTSNGELNYRLIYYDHKIQETLVLNIWNHWTAVISTPTGNQTSNHRMQSRNSTTEPLQTSHTSDVQLSSRGKYAVS